MASHTVTTKDTALSQPRPENLAFTFQEVLTAILRLRTNRQSLSDATVFRAQVKEALNLADKDAKKLGYSPETARQAVFAAVAFLDESVLNQQNSTFADWVRKPLQEELFGVHVAGEIFFENLRRLLGQADSIELADLLEVHQLCLLLGYRGRYGAGAKGELRALMDAIDEKIRRIRGEAGPLSPAARLSDEQLPMQPDPWDRRVLFLFVACLSLALLLFIVFDSSLSSAISALRALVSQIGKAGQPV